MDPRAHLFLNGGGDAPDTALIDRAFVAALGGGPLLYWPLARAPDTYDACRAWFADHMETLGVTQIEMWTDANRRPRTLAAFSGLYIGGGDTYRLIESLRTTDLERLLVDAAAGGLPIFGGSAGAIILGADMSTWVPAGAMRPPVDQSRGLDLLDGSSIWAEYDARDVDATRAWSAEGRSPLLALHCAAGVIANDGALVACGREPVLRIDAGGTTAFAHGEQIA